MIAIVVFHPNTSITNDFTPFSKISRASNDKEINMAYSFLQNTHSAENSIEPGGVLSLGHEWLTDHIKDVLDRSSKRVNFQHHFLFSWWWSFYSPTGWTLILLASEIRGQTIDLILLVFFLLVGTIMTLSELEVNRSFTICLGFNGLTVVMIIPRIYLSVKYRRNA